MNQENQLVRIALLSNLIAVVALMLGLLVVLMLQYPGIFPLEEVPATETAIAVVEDKIENGLDVASGLVAEGEYLIVRQNCTACHSGKLVTQNRASREGWLDMIRWMQKTQKLWDLGPQEDKILDYLATYYGPEKKGRRAPLVVEEWYVIE